MGTDGRMSQKTCIECKNKPAAKDDALCEECRTRIVKEFEEWEAEHFPERWDAAMKFMEGMGELL